MRQLNLGKLGSQHFSSEDTIIKNITRSCLPVFRPVNADSVCFLRLTCVTIKVSLIQRGIVIHLVFLVSVSDT